AAFGGFAAMALSGHGNLSEVLVAAGKDPSLTGRTYLWERAAQYIAERPVFGLGYQAFWVQGHVEAEGLWRYAQIDTRAGFHFHNVYYETAVELGLVGVVLLGLSIVLWFGAIILWSLRRPGPQSGFFAGLMVFYALRLFVELDFLGPFSPGSFLLPLGWVYAAASCGPTRRSTHSMMPQPTEP
ncbi:MAG: O-antigen ligase family protein, partial [Janthinobacterium lividum]